MSDWPNEDEPEDLISLTDLDEDEQIYSLAEVAYERERKSEVSELLPEEITRLLSPLDERSREVLKMRFGLAPYVEFGLLEEAAEAFSVTQERVRQIEARALAKLRWPSLDTGEDDLKSVQIFFNWVKSDFYV